MTTDNFCFYLQNRLIQTSQTGGQRYSDTSPFSIPWTDLMNEDRLECGRALCLEIQARPQLSLPLSLSLSRTPS